MGISMHPLPLPSFFCLLCSDFLYVSCNLTFQFIKCYLLCPKFLHTIFFLLNLYLGCTTNHRYITFGYLLHLMVESPFLFFMASSLLKKWMEQETRVRETPQRLWYRHSWRPFWMCLLTPACLFDEALFWGKKYWRLLVQMLDCHGDY